MERRVLKLSRIASLLQPFSLISSFAFGLFFIIAGVIEAREDAELFWLYFIESIFVVLVLLVSMTTVTTGKIYIDKDYMEFTYHQRARSNNFKHRSRHVRVKYTVTEIENLRFEQNALEKIFNCGHFSFNGNTVYESNAEGFEPKTEFTFYGLTHFRQTKKEICDILGVNETE